MLFGFNKMESIGKHNKRVVPEKNCKVKRVQKMVTHFDNLSQIWLTGRKRKVLRLGIKGGGTVDFTASRSMMVSLERNSCV